jgi:hypothetical protein
MPKKAPVQSAPLTTWITVPEAAQALGLGVSKVKTLCGDGTLVAVKVKDRATWRWSVSKPSVAALQASTQPKTITAQLAQEILGALKKSRRRSQPMTFSELVEELDRSPKSIRAAIAELQATGVNVVLGGDENSEESVGLSGDVQPGAGDALIVHPREFWNNKWYEFGALGDNHLGSKHERLDVCNALYDMYAAEGITEVYNTGNMIEGECRFNKHDIKVFTLDGQVQYWIDKYPQRPGITTYFVTGDDHEGWYQQREGIEIGRYMQQCAEKAGRHDLKYLGYVEADILLKAEHGERLMKVTHPGGGATYALSYAMQKWVEALQGGEKPSVVLAGHYHKMDFNFYREVYAVQTGCTVDQSIFMRKKKIQAHVGGCRVKLNQAPDGQITRFMVEFMTFYDRGYYSKPRKF